MELFRDFLRQYWLNMLAFAVFVAAVVRYVQLGQWEQQLVPFAVAGLGFMCVVASDEVSDWTGWYGWTRQQWRQYPVEFVRFAGALALVVATIMLYRS